MEAFNQQEIDYHTHQVVNFALYNKFEFEYIPNFALRIVYNNGKNDITFCSPLTEDSFLKSFYNSGSYYQFPIFEMIDKVKEVTREYGR